MDILLLVWNLIVFFLYGIDKRRSIKNEWRISEKALLSCAFFMGGVGAFLGMTAFRHKTKKRKFQILIPLFVVLNFYIYKLYF